MAVVKGIPEDASCEKLSGAERSMGKRRNN
jgi:hypothetical protein